MSIACCSMSGRREDKILGMVKRPALTWPRDPRLPWMRMPRSTPGQRNSSAKRVMLPPACAYLTVALAPAVPLQPTVGWPVQQERSCEASLCGSSGQRLVVLCCCRLCCSTLWADLCIGCSTLPQGGTQRPNREVSDFQLPYKLSRLRDCALRKDYSDLDGKQGVHLRIGSGAGHCQCKIGWYLAALDEAWGPLLTKGITVPHAKNRG